MQTLRVTIPEGLSFEALKLTRNQGRIRFEWAAIEAVCASSNIDVGLLRDTDEDNVAGLIVAWYDVHRQLGGAPDPVADELIAEALLEAERGHGFSHPPGDA